MVLQCWGVLLIWITVLNSQLVSLSSKTFLKTKLLSISQCDKLLLSV